MGKMRYSSTILDLGTREKCVVNFTLRLLYSLGKAPGTHCIGGCMGPRAGRNAMEKIKPLASPGN
jgi:hypothetical protein